MTSRAGPAPLDPPRAIGRPDRAESYGPAIYVPPGRSQGLVLGAEGPPEDFYAPIFDRCAQPSYHHAVPDRGDTQRMSDGPRRQSPRLPVPAIWIALGAAAVLFAAYVIPLRGGGPSGYTFSLLLGPRLANQPTPVLSAVMSAVRSFGVLGLLIGSVLVPIERSLLPLRSGLLLGIGVLETLFFLYWVGNGSLVSIAAWLGVLGGLGVIAAGLMSLRTAGTTVSN